MERVRVEDRGFSSPCWVWQLSLTEKGYARTKVPGFGKVRVHRASYEIHVGQIPDGLVIDHLCRVPACVNPFHLEPVTVGENNRRAIRAGGRANERQTHCQHGHPLSGENMWTNNRGYRTCRTCRNAYMREWNKTHPPKPRDRYEYNRLRRQRLREAA